MRVQDRRRYRLYRTRRIVVGACGDVGRRKNQLQPTQFLLLRKGESWIKMTMKLPLAGWFWNEAELYCASLNDHYDVERKDAAA